MPRAASACRPEPFVDPRATALREKRRTGPRDRRDLTDPLGRLRVRRDFLRVAAERRKSVSPGLVLQVAPSGLEPAIAGATRRVGFTASKKVGGAVLRNRAKRRLREAARAVMTPHARPGLDYVIIARDTTPSRPYRLLLADLEAGLRRLKAWREADAAD